MAKKKVLKDLKKAFKKSQKDVKESIAVAKKAGEDAKKALAKAQAAEESAKKAKKKLKVVDNQWGRPTNGIDLAKTILKLIFNNSIFTFPILHYANHGVCSWKEFAETIVKELNLKVEINGIPTSAYPTLVKRPKYSILDTQRIEKELKIEIPSWQISLKKCIQNLKNEEGF